MLPIRKETPVAVTILLVLLAAALIPVAFGAVTNVTTNKSTYFPGELVTISGTADPNSNVAIQVTNPSGTIIFLHTVLAGAAGTFSDSFRLAGDAATGSYSVAADGRAAQFEVQRDTVAPTIGSITFDKPTYLAGDTVSFSVQITDNAAVTRVTSDVTTLTRTAGTEQSGTWSGNFKAPGTPGTFSISVTAEDGSGNRNTQTASYNVATLQSLAGGSGLSINVNPPTIAYQGQTINIYVLVAFQGTYPPQVNFGSSTSPIPNLGGPGFAHVHDPQGAATPITLERIHNGLFRASYQVPNVAGTYVVVVPAQANGTGHISSAGFAVNPKFPDQDNLATRISNAQNALADTLNGIRSDVTAINSAVSGISTKIDQSTTAITNAANEIRTSVSTMRDNLNSVSGAVSQVSIYVIVAAVLALLTLVAVLAIIIRKK